MKKLYLSFFGSMLLTFFISMLAFGSLYHGYFAPRYEEKLVSAHESYFSKLSFSFDMDLDQYQEIAVQIANDSHFSTQYISQHQYNCFEITKTLRAYRGCNPRLLDIVYVNRKNPYIYTSMGAYNPLYYEEGSVVSREFASGLLWDESFLSPVEQFTTVSQRRVMEYVVPVMYSSAALVFQIDAGSLETGFSEEDGMLLLSGGERIFSANIDPELESRLLEDIAAGNSSSGEFGRDYYLYHLQSSQPGVSFVFLTPYHQLVGEYVAMNFYFLLFSLGFTALCLVVSLLLARRHYRPIQKLNTLFDEVVEDIPRDYSELQAIDFAVRQFISHQELLLQEKALADQERVLRRLVSGGDLDIAVIDQQCREAGIAIADRSCCVLFLGVKDRKPVPGQLRSEFSACLARAGIQFYSAEYIEQSSGLYLCALPPDGEGALYEIVRDIAAAVSQSSAIPFFVSVGSACRGYRDIARSFREARVTAQLQESFPGETVLRYLKLQPMNSSDYLYPSAEIDGLYSAIVSRNCRQVRQLTDLLVEQARAAFGSNYLSRCLCYDIANTMLRAVSELERASSAPISISILPDLMEFRRFSDFEGFIRGMETAIVSQFSGGQHQNQELCARIVQYIKDNVQSPDLCIKTLCSHFHISQSTLSALFREKMGMTVAGYIGALRSEYVKSLLLSTDLSISEITQQLGYSQPSSFIRQFKNAEGITPGEYRQKFRMSG